MRRLIETMQRAVDHPRHPPLKILHHLFFLPAHSHLPSFAAARTLCIPRGRRLDFPLRSYPAPLWLAAATGPNNNVPLLDLHSLYRALKYASHEDRRATETESSPRTLKRAPLAYPIPTSEFYRQRKCCFRFHPPGQNFGPTENIYLAGRIKCPRILSCNIIHILSLLYTTAAWNRLNFVISIIILYVKYSLFVS